MPTNGPDEVTASEPLLLDDGSGEAGKNRRIQAQLVFAEVPLISLFLALHLLMPLDFFFFFFCEPFPFHFDSFSFFLSFFLFSNSLEGGVNDERGD